MIDVQELQAGPPLDALVAEKVMGWTAYRYEREGTPQVEWRERLENGGFRFHHDWAPSTSIASAWMVFEYLRRNLYHVEVLVGPGKPTHVVCRIIPLGETEKIVSYANEAPLAICRAAIALVDKQERGG